MIIYTTKQTNNEFIIPMPEESSPRIRKLIEKVLNAETDDALMEWGGKVFYFDGCKCLQVVNFASRFTLFLCDVKYEDIESVPDMIVQYLMDIYSEDKPMIKALTRMFEEHPMVCYSKLTNRSIISSLNHIQSGFLDDGYRLYDYISDGILHTKKINRDVNFNYLVRIERNGKKDYHYSGEVFRELVLERFGGKASHKNGRRK